MILTELYCIFLDISGIVALLTVGHVLPPSILYVFFPICNHTILLALLLTVWLLISPKITKFISFSQIPVGRLGQERHNRKAAPLKG